MIINIKKAQVEDLPDILKILDEVHLYKIQELDINKGFLVHNQKSEYEYRLKNGNFNYISIFNNKIIGFFTTLSNFEVSELLNKKYLKYEREVLQFLINNKNRFIWMDQIAIYPENYRKMKIGSKLVKHCIDISLNHEFTNFYGIISLYPEANLAGINFFYKLGFTIIRTFQIENRYWGLISKIITQ